MSFNSSLDAETVKRLTKNIQHLIYENRLSNSETARRTGLSAACINRLVKGDMAAPTVHTLKALGSYFNLYWADLVDKDLVNSRDDIDVIVDKVIERLSQR